MILCPECLILAIYLATKKISVDLGLLPVVWWGLVGSPWVAGG